MSENFSFSCGKKNRNGIWEIFMSRKRMGIKRELKPDPKYNSVLAAKFINNLMSKGKKSTAQAILYEAFGIIEEKTKKDPLSVFQTALENVRPAVEVKSRRVGGSTYQVPTEVRPARRQALSMRWIIGFATGRGEKTMAAKLAGELMDAASERGASIKKREDTHRMAEANKAFAHYRW
ncbi:ribosomal protein S7 [delta proteobacterium NaphS2]|nr:ribosomal protein S7 [delta proteobacterium NaphS2]